MIAFFPHDVYLKDECNLCMCAHNVGQEIYECIFPLYMVRLNVPNSRENYFEAQRANIWLASYPGVQMECIPSAHNLAFSQSSRPTGPQLEARGSLLTISISNPWPRLLNFIFWSFLDMPTPLHLTTQRPSDLPSAGSQGAVSLLMGPPASITAFPPYSSLQPDGSLKM